MKLNAPKKIVWMISTIIAVVSVVSLYISIPVVSAHAFWFMGVAWLLLFLGNVLKGF